MEREIIKIDEEKCNGCGLCIPNCHEGALQIIDGKARLVSELMCDGLGACIGHCPEDALEIEVREAEPYDEIKVIKEMVPKGKNVVTAHLLHLKDHNEADYLSQAAGYLTKNKDKINFPVEEVLAKIGSTQNAKESGKSVSASEMQSGETPAPKGCPGARSFSFGKDNNQPAVDNDSHSPSQLRQWPVQLHLINPDASHFRGSDLLLAADCTAFASGNFHSAHLKNRTLAIACPKLDRNQEIYFNKIADLIDRAKINTLTVMIMEVPCCSGLLQMARSAVKEAARKVPLKQITLGIKGNILSEEWV